MNPEDLVGSLLSGALSARGKRSQGTLGYLMGGRHSLLSASTLMSAAAVAWGMYEASQSSQERGMRRVPAPTGPAPDGFVPPPPPPAAARPAASGPPAENAPLAATAGFPRELARLIQLLISAARADGDLSPEEGQLIARRAGESGAEDLVRAELQSPRPLAEIVAGVTDEKQKAELYALAFSIVRADESVSGAERIYLAQLAKHLGLDAVTTARLEAESAARIDASGGEPHV